MKQQEIAGRGGTIARGLGWFSIGLGMAELVAPGKLSEWIGVEEHDSMIRLLGLREMASGIGILMQDRPTESLWSRVAGDCMDLGLLGVALASPKSEKKKVLAAIAAVGGVMALDAVCSVMVTQSGRSHLVRSLITINRPQSEVYEFWRDSKNLRQCMKGVPQELSIVDSSPVEFVEFRSSDGKLVKSGSVLMRPALGRDGTEIEVVVDGLVPVLLLHEDVRRAKRLIETGEIPTTEGQSAGPRSTSAVSRLIHRLEGKEAA